MEISCARAFSFSPTDSTKGVLETIGAALPWDVEQIDITDYSTRENTYHLAADELLIAGAPVYGGRIPVPASERFARITGDGSPALIVATFGAREFEDALVEFRDILTAQGFQVVGAIAAVTQHSIFPHIAAGRPNVSDKEELSAFAKRFAEKLSSADAVPAEPQIPGNRPYKPLMAGSLMPAADDSCTQCGQCADACPVAAIPEDAPDQTDPQLCIGCLRCIKVCPVDARRIPAGPYGEADKMITARCDDNKPNSFFLD